MEDLKKLKVKNSKETVKDRRRLRRRKPTMGRSAKCWWRVTAAINFHQQ